MKENIINYIPLQVYRFIRWRVSQQKAYAKNREAFCEEYAKLCFEAARLEYFKRPTEQIMAVHDRKHRMVVDHVEQLCADVIDRYKTVKPEPDPGEEKRIWVFWWSGEETAPDIVKACIRSIRKHANGHQVVFLDQHNYQDYVQFPAYIHEKHNAGVISHAQFSDMLRFSLLAQYGGAWIDATVFVSQDLPETMFSVPFYSCKTFYPDSAFFSKSRWCSYFMASNQNTKLFRFARDIILDYWSKSDKLVDYLLVDYILGIAYDHFEDVRHEMDSLPENNFKRGLLMDSINQPYSEELFRKLQTEETFASKLSWRYGNPTEKTKDGKLTNYGYLLSL